MRTLAEETTEGTLACNEPHAMVHADMPVSLESPLRSQTEV